MKMPLAERFAAYNRLRKRQGKEPVTMTEYTEKHHGKNGVLARKAPDGKGCVFPLWRHGDRPNHLYCGAVKRGDGPYCAQHAAICYQPGTSYLDVSAERAYRRGIRRKAMVFGAAA